MAKRSFDRRKESDLRTFESSGRPSNPEDDTPHGLGLAFAGQMAAFALSVPVALLFYDSQTKQLRQSPAATAAMFLPLWVAFAITIRSVANRRAEPAFGRKPFVKSVDAVAVVVGVFAQIAIGIVYFALPVDMEEVGRPAREIFDRANDNPGGIALLAIAVGVGAPIMEELFYRGVVHRGLRMVFRKRAWQPIAAYVVSSAIFAAIHFQVIQFPALFAVGMLCAYAYEKTGRIATAIAVHAGFNLTTVASLVYSSVN